MYINHCQTCNSELDYLGKSVRSLETWKDIKQRFKNFQLDCDYRTDKFFFSEDNFQFIFEDNAKAVLSILNRAINFAKPSAPSCSICSSPVEELFTKDGQSRGLFSTPAHPDFSTSMQQLYQVHFPINEEILEDKNIIQSCEYMGYSSTEELTIHPFFTEVTLYGLYGKDDARSILSILRSLLQVGGL